jgi:hypothetical protein
MIEVKQSIPVKRTRCQALIPRIFSDSPVFFQKTHEMAKPRDEKGDFSTTLTSRLFLSML